MVSKGFFETLKDLKGNRRLSSESEAIISSFVGWRKTLHFSFINSQNTLSSRLDEKYSKGKTVLAKFSDYELDCSILFPASENDWIVGLRREEEFESDVEVMEFDNLYQRVVFGKFLEEEDIPTESELERTSNKLKSEDFEQGKTQTDLDEQPLEISKTPENELNKEEVITDSINTFSNAGLQKKEDKKQGVSDSEISDDKQTDTVQPSINAGVGLSNRSLQIKNETNENEGNDSYAKGYTPEFEKTDTFPENVQKKQAQPTSASLEIKKRGVEISQVELEKIRNKHHEEEKDSVAREVEEILNFARNGIKKYHAVQKSKNLSITKRTKKKETEAVDTKDIVHLLLRLIFGLVSCMYGIISGFSYNGSGAEAIFAFAIAWYLLKPIVKDME